MTYPPKPEQRDRRTFTQRATAESEAIWALVDRMDRLIALLEKIAEGDE